MENMELLKNVFMFRDLTTMELLHFGKILKHRKVKNGETIVRSGEKGEEMFIIKSGAVNVYAEDSSTGKQRLIAILGKGDHFGEIALFREGERIATVTARDDTDLLILDRKDLDKILSSDKDIAIKIYRAMIDSLAERLKKTNILALI